MADQSFFQTTMRGPIVVAFDGEGSQTVDASIGDVLDAVMEADVRLTRQGVFYNNRRDPPYEFVSYDEGSRTLVVRRKR